MPETEKRACAVCARPLMPVEVDGKTTWIHTVPDDEDHIAVPVRQDEVQTAHRCDFCTQDKAAYTLPTYSFKMPGLGVADITANAGEDWATCEACAELIEKNQWSALHRRVITTWETRHERPMEEASQGALKAMYRSLRKNISGSMKPLNP